MKDPLFNTLSGLASLGIVLAAVLLAGSGRDGPAPQVRPAGLAEQVAAAELQGAAVVAAELQAATVAAAELQTGEEADAPQRRSRRVRASLTMPYFSFAQSLRPGG